VTPTVALFSNRGGIGRTSLLYHLAWMYADQGRAVLAVDLDPQANLTAAMVEQERLETLWSSGGPSTIHGAIAPVVTGAGDISAPHREPIAQGLELIVGDLALSRFDDELASQWARCLDRQDRAFRVISAFHRCIQQAAAAGGAEIVLIDLGPTLGALNRAALVACRNVAIPVAPDLLSLQALRTLGPVVQQWSDEWRDRVATGADPALGLPADAMRPAGYLVVQHPARLDRPMQAHDQWLRRIPEAYANAVLGESTDAVDPVEDPRCLGIVKRYDSLMPMAEEVRKPIFHLRPADGALGAHAAAVRAARKDIETIADRIAAAIGLPPRQRERTLGAR
jgi:cellulose biosynthesis protein BcsQ